MNRTIFKSYGMYSLDELKELEANTKEFLSESYPEIEQTEENIYEEIMKVIEVENVE